MNDTPELRLRARHRLCQPCTGHGSMAGEPHCYHCWESWPCEVIMALDALLPSDVESLRLSIESINGHAERKDAKIRALQGRLDIATKLIRQAMEERHYSQHGGIVSSVPGPAACPDCRQYREWLAGTEGEE